MIGKVSSTTSEINLKLWCGVHVSQTGGVKNDQLFNTPNTRTIISII